MPVKRKSTSQPIPSQSLASQASESTEKSSCTKKKKHSKVEQTQQNSETPKISTIEVSEKEPNLEAKLLEIQVDPNLTKSVLNDSSIIIQSLIVAKEPDEKESSDRLNTEDLSLLPHTHTSNQRETIVSINESATDLVQVWHLNQHLIKQEHRDNLILNISKAIKEDKRIQQLTKTNEAQLKVALLEMIRQFVIILSYYSKERQAMLLQSKKGIQVTLYEQFCATKEQVKEHKEKGIKYSISDPDSYRKDMESCRRKAIIVVSAVWFILYLFLFSIVYVYVLLLYKVY